MFIFHRRPEKQTAAVFVDYEHWYYAYLNKYSMKTNVEEWYNELKEEYTITDLRFFGDFSGFGIEKDLPRLEKLTKSVIHTCSTKSCVDKDFTDFIVLDAIYRKAVSKDSPEVFIIFTGDAHFDLVVKYLRSLKKKVIVYGVKRSLSNKLKASANSYVEMPRNNQEQKYYYDLILNTLYYLKNQHKFATYHRTVQSVAKRNDIIKDRIQNAMDDLINNKYIGETDRYYKGRRTRVLEANWQRLQEEGMWSAGNQ